LNSDSLGSMESAPSRIVGITCGAAGAQGLSDAEVTAHLLSPALGARLSLEGRAPDQCEKIDKTARPQYRNCGAVREFGARGL
jgi:hypothetical protein